MATTKNKIYRITYTRGYNNQQHTIDVFASSAVEAIEFGKRFAKKNYWSEFEVVGLEKVLNVDVYYKTK